MLNKCRAEKVQVYLQPFRRNSLLKCVSQPKIAEKSTKNPYFEGSRSFKVIDVDSNKKPVTSACHEPKGSGLRLLKSTFNAENFIRRLSWSNSACLCLSATVFTLHEIIAVK